jgi:CheY-like chemotaxis protein
METSRKKILVVDDDASIVRMLRTCLEVAGYDVVAACDGAQALGRVKTDEPNLLILDIMMPRMSGFETLKALKNSAETRHLPVIFLTAYSTDENLIKSIDLDSQYFISKPFETNVLLTVVQRLLQVADEEEIAHG